MVTSFKETTRVSYYSNLQILGVDGHKKKLDWEKITKITLNWWIIVFHWFHSFMYGVYIEGNHHSKNGKEWYKEGMI